MASLQCTELHATGRIEQRERETPLNLTEHLSWRRTVTPALVGPESANLILSHTQARSSLEKLGSTPLNLTLESFLIVFLVKSITDS